MPQTELELKAVAQAIKLNWAKAAEINTEILIEFPEDVPTINRLAKAYMEMGEINKCIKTLKLVLRIDKYNPIALKNLQKAGQIHVKGGKKTNNLPTRTIKSTCLFIEEPGKTKIFRLLNLAPKSILITINPLDEVTLAPKRHTIQILNMEGKYVGALPDDVAKRLTTLIKGGNKYEAFVKSAEKKEIDVFIRETFKGSKYKNQPSFLTRLKDIKEKDLKIEAEERESEEKDKDKEEDEQEL